MEVALPSAPLDTEQSERTGLLLAVADFVHNFHAPLGLPRVDLDALQGMLACDSAASDPPSACPKLCQLFERLVQVCSWWGAHCADRVAARLTEGAARSVRKHTSDCATNTEWREWLQVVIAEAPAEEAPHRQDARWRAALSAATWPEVLRRYILTRLFCQDAPLATLAAAQAADRLATVPLAALPPIDKLRLLALACDEAADSAQLRTELRLRTDRIEEVRALLLRYPAAHCQAQPDLATAHLLRPHECEARPAPLKEFSLGEAPDRHACAQARASAREAHAGERAALREAQDAAKAAQAAKRELEVAQLGGAAPPEPQPYTGDANDACASTLHLGCVRG